MSGRGVAGGGSETGRAGEVRAIVRRGGGVVTRAELLGAGVALARLRTVVRRGALVPVLPGVYALAGVVAAARGDPAREHALLAAAAARTTGALAVASHRSAGIIHGLDLLNKPEPGLVTLTRPPCDSRSRARLDAAAVHVAELPPDQVTRVLGAPVTTVARTVIDLARELPFADGVVAADAARHRRMTTGSELRDVLASCSRWPGVRRAEQVVAFSDPRAESALESIARVAIHEGGLPPPELQVWVGDVDTGAVIGRADFLWSQHGTVGEADGALKYAEPGRAIRQLRRDALLRAAGFEVVHFTWSEITMAPGQVIAALRRAFERGEAARRRDG